MEANYITRPNYFLKSSRRNQSNRYVYKQLSEQYNQEVVQQSKIITTVLEPFVILFVGVFSGSFTGCYVFTDITAE
nr:hypothetical protein [uncultured Flavobacterium sp.]